MWTTTDRKRMEMIDCWLWSSLFLGCVLLFSAARKLGCPRFSLLPPPGPTPLPLLGNLLELGQNPHSSLARLARKHGPVMALNLGSVYTIVVSSPSSARQVLLTRDRCFSGRHVPDALQGHGHHAVSVAWMPPNKSWKSLRSLMKLHLFNPRSLDASRSLRRCKVQELLSFIREQGGQAVNIGMAAFSTMLNLISSSFFSMDIVDANSDTAQEFSYLVRGLMEEAGSPNISDFFPFLASLDLQGRRHRFAACCDKLCAIFDRIITNRLEGDGTIISEDMLDVLLKYKEEDGSKLSMLAIKAFLIDSFAAGSDTSSSTVEWAMAELLRRPELMERVRLEIEEATGSERDVDESDFSSLPFFHAVLKETLRLHPPVPLLLPHKPEEDTEISGYRVPRGSQVLVNVWAIGRDERVWENPDCFIPERFMGGPGGRSDVDFYGQHFELLPFGSGRRMCPGLPLGTKMVQLILASLIQSFQWKLPEGMTAADLNLQENFGVTLALASPLKAIAIPLRRSKDV